MPEVFVHRLGDTHTIEICKDGMSIMIDVSKNGEIVISSEGNSRAVKMEVVCRNNDKETGVENVVQIEIIPSFR